MFKVINKYDLNKVSGKEIYEVFAVKTEDYVVEFLVFDRNGWKFIDSNLYVPYVEEDRNYYRGEEY